jgi:hypothetical protein
MIHSTSLNEVHYAMFQGLIIVYVDGARGGGHEAAGLMAVKIGLANPCQIFRVQAN